MKARHSNIPYLNYSIYSKFGGPFTVFFNMTWIHKRGKRPVRCSSVYKLYFYWLSLPESEKQKYYDMSMNHLAYPFPTPIFDVNCLSTRNSQISTITRTPYIDWLIWYLNEKATEEELSMDAFELSIELGKVWKSLPKEEKEKWAFEYSILRSRNYTYIRNLRCLKFSRELEMSDEE